MSPPREPFVILGATGMLGRAWTALARARGLAHRAYDLPAVDVCRPETLSPVITGAGTIINCTGWTDVDGAEDDEDGATRVNGSGVAALVRACYAEHVALVHYSTDYVFDGRAREPYAVDAVCAPLNAYGRSKLAGEAALRTSGTDAWLVRTSWLYAPWGRNFVRSMLQRLAAGQAVCVVSDQRGRPTSAQYLAERTLALLQQAPPGTYHVCDGGECTWYELTCELARLIESGRVEPCTTGAFPRRARRPSYGVLDLGATETLIGPSVDWRANVAQVVRAAQPGGKRRPI